MPQIGTIEYGRVLGYKAQSNPRYIWSKCKGCGLERWVQYCHGGPRWLHCRSCSQRVVRHSPTGEAHYNWKGGVSKGKGDYLVQRIDRYGAFSPMLCNRKGNTVLQHRLIMAQHLGRCLSSKEHVHHLNGIKTDNRIENLAITNVNEHEQNTLNRILQERIKELELQILVGWQGK